jgi:hypothetical protein
MSDKLTDIKGIGEKTAEKLQEQGIETPAELEAEFRRVPTSSDFGPTSDLNKRAREGIKRRLEERGETYIDPDYRIPASEENREAREFFDQRLGKDVVQGFGAFTRDNPRYQNKRNVLDLAGEALRGNLSRDLDPDDYEEMGNRDSVLGNEGLEEADEARRARKEAFEFGLDAAANITEYDREEIERGNEFARRFTKAPPLVAQQTETVEREIGGETTEAEDNITLSPRTYGRAMETHRERGPEARRVDNNRKAPTTSDYSEWRENPSELDMPGVDTPGGSQDFTSPEARQTAEQTEQILDKSDKVSRKIAFGETESLFPE